MEMCIFANHRYIYNVNMYNSIKNNIYRYINKKGGVYIYISLLIDGQYIDVNIHPNKMEVLFLNENYMCDYLCKYLYKGLSEYNYIPTTSLSPSTPATTLSVKESQENHQVPSPSPSPTKPDSIVYTTSTSKDVSSQECALIILSRHSWYIRVIVDELNRI